MASDASGSSRWSSVNVFLPPNTAGPSRIPSPPAEDPKPTPAELKEAFASHISQRHGPDAPLMTKSMREKEEARLGAKRKEYNEIRIRIRFSDRTALEGRFPAHTQIPVLYDFVRSHLDEKYRKVPFVIYQSPPKRDYPEKSGENNKQQTIKELGMAPQAILSIRWSDGAMNSNTFQAPLHAEVKATAKELPPPPSFDGTSPDTTQDAPAATASSDGHDKTKKAIPKWLKGLQKK